MRALSASRLRLRQDRAFTLAELLVSIAVITLVALLVTGLMNSASSLTVMGGKHISADTQARVVLDRMAVDFARMLKRTDVDYYLKTDCPSCYPGHSYGHSQGHGHRGDSSNDQITFFAQVPGYYPPTGAPSPISLVSYRVNSNVSGNGSPGFNKLQRMAVGLQWNGVSNGNYHQQNYYCPIFFLPQSSWTTDITQPNTPGAGYYLGQGWAWPSSIVSNAEDSSYETIGPGVFRFEYYYLLKNGYISENPFINKADPTAPHYRDVNGMNDVEAIVVSIAVIDSRSRALLTDQNILDLSAKMADFNTINQHPPPFHTYAKANDVEIQWNCVATNGASGNCNLGTVTFPDAEIAAMPKAAVSAIRVYTRYFDLNNL